MAAILPAVVATGCNSFLEGTGITTNPNKPTNATADQLWVGVQAAQMAQWEAYPFNLLPLWAQQIQGVQRQWQNYAQYRSGTDNLTADPAWNGAYTGGGFADIKRIENELNSAGNKRLFLGEARVMEALVMGTNADIWGDVPYSQAAQGVANPTFDKQADVYAHVLAVLDSAIADLAADQNGAATDFFFGNDATKWTGVAHTLKGRYLLHQSRGADSSTQFAAALTEAQSGISSEAGTMQSVHTGDVGAQNLFYVFLTGPRAGDVEPSAIHIGIMQALNDNVLLAATYNKGTAGTYVGSAAGQTAGTTVSTFAIKIDSPIGLVTFAENQMMIAELQYRTGNAGAAATTFASFRTAAGETIAAPAPGGTNGLLIQILEEKYARDFINPNVFFDYMRTCVPNIPMPAAHSDAFNWVPARFVYGYTEDISNPNVPTPEPNANANTPLNAKDPAGAVCAGQANRLTP
ncbi:MAG TPA: SusD/RagB family nutrient-binding outer membrane lipoprotein [Gemmatimonadaceae bacterium]|nr:SusD/RagB family nutrient-binding outer membrane lipoprotein [Gemmatimonadaceae bacterium]